MAKSTLGTTGRNLPTRLKVHQAHGRRGYFDKSSIAKHSQHQGQSNRLAGPSPTHYTYQLMASYRTHQRDHRNLQARHCSTGHRFLHQWYLATTTTDRRIFYIQSPQPNWGISYILSQPVPFLLCLLTTDSVQWAHTRSSLKRRSSVGIPPLQGSQPHQFPACTLQRTSWTSSNHSSRDLPPAVCL